MACDARRRAVAQAVCAAALCVSLLALGVPTVFGAGVSLDDEIPGLAVPESPHQGSLTATENPFALDVRDVFSLTLGRNERLDVTVTVPPAADYGVYLLAPGTRTVDSALAPPFSRVIAYADRAVTGGSEAFSYVSDIATPSVHYLVVKQWSGSGPYTLSWAHAGLPAPSIVSTTPAVVSYATTASVVATVSGADGDPLPRVRAVLLARPSGQTTWTAVAESTSTASGRVAFRVKPARRTAYRVKTRYHDAADGTRYGYGLGAVMTISPKAYLTIESAPARATAGRRFSVAGRLKPSHAASKRHVLVEARWRRSKTDRWRSVDAFPARNDLTRWNASLVLTRRATWQVRVRVPADALHAQTASSWRTVRVR